MDTQDIVTGADLGYRPLIEDDHNTIPNPYSREGMAQQMGHMDDIPMYEDADIEWLYFQPEADVGDSETQGVENPHSGTTGATKGEQSEDPAARVLRDKEIRTINLGYRHSSYKSSELRQNLKKLDETYLNDVLRKKCALENKPEYVGRVRQVGPDILPVLGNTQTYYTPSQSWTLNTNDSSHMAERIRELKVERD
ncbi:hypothetical protein FH972_011163 [Carpinus fangiana]|uniref:Uncharacterized protein n=1 Tax=Carpinus fangiana TaxID=176857 RepID=A0A660KQI1_9ROSI|nr:hypothetical protein FH972_011163 [Carpinus fangiana]